MTKKKELSPIEQFKELLPSLVSIPSEQLDSIDINDVIESIKGIISFNTGESVRKFIDANLYFKDVSGLSYPFFRLCFSIPEIGLFIKIKTRGEGMGSIFKKLKERFIERGEKESDAMRKANHVITEFYSACSEITSKKEGSAFIANVFRFNKNKKGTHQNESTPM